MKTTTPKTYILAATRLCEDIESPLPGEYEDSIGLSKPWMTDAEAACCDI